MRLILVGPPGSGKGTQAKLLSKRLNLQHIGTGDILREAIRQDSPLGRLAEPYIVAGQLVPDDLVNEVIADRFKRDDRPGCFVIDGYPRTVAQAASFDQVLRQQFLDLSAVLVFEVDDEEIVRRMSGRWCCPNCKSTFHVVSKPPLQPGVCDVCKNRLIQRSDDREETVRERLRVYHASTQGLVAHYHAQGVLHTITGIGDIEQIYSSIMNVLKKVRPSC